MSDVTGGNRHSLPPPSFISLPKIHYRLQQLVLRFNGLGISLVGSLGGNHIDQLGSKLYVGILDCVGLQSTQAAGLGRAHERHAGGCAFRPGIVALYLQPLRISKIGQYNLSQV